MLAALPVLSMLKHTMDFFEIEFSRAPWFADDGVDGDVAGSALVPESSGSGSELTGDASGGVAGGVRLRKMELSKVSQSSGLGTMSSIGRMKMFWPSGCALASLRRCAYVEYCGPWNT